MKKKVAGFLIIPLLVTALTGCGLNETVSHTSEFKSEYTNEDVDEVIEENYEPAEWTNKDESDDKSAVEGSSSDALAKFSNLDFWGFKNINPGHCSMYDEDIERLTSNLTAADKRFVLEKVLKNQGGLCYGLAVSSALSNRGIVSTADLNTNSSTMKKADFSDSLLSSINFYHIQQGLSVSVNKMSEFLDLDNDEQMRRLMKAGMTGKPFVIGYWNMKTDKYAEGAHAVVGYGIESGSWSYKNKTYPFRICVYDSNVPSDIEKGSYDIYLNLDGGYWCIPGYGFYSTTNGHTNSKTDNVRLMRLVTENDYLNVVDINTGDTSSAYKKSNGISVPVVSTDMGQVLTVKSSSGEANLKGSVITDSTYEGTSFKTFCSMDAAPKSNLLYIVFPEGEEYYMVDSDKTDLDITMRVGSSYIAISSDSPAEATINNNGTIEVKADSKNATTTVEYVNEGSKLGMDGEPCISVEERNGADITITPSSSGIKIDADKNSDLKVAVENYGKTEEVKVNSDTNTILVGLSSSKVVIKEDSNADGTYDKKLGETALPKSDAKLTLKNKTAKYSKKAVKISTATAKNIKSKITYTYYIDKKCKVRTTTKNSGASKTGGAPVYGGIYYVRATALLDGSYTVKSNVAKLTIKKSAGTFKLKKTAFSVKKTSVKKKAQSITLSTTPKGNNTYKKVSGNSKITVSKSGKVTVKKGTKAGTYKVKVKVTSSNYTKAKTQTITITVK